MHDPPGHGRVEMRLWGKIHKPEIHTTLQGFRPQLSQLCQMRQITWVKELGVAAWAVEVTVNLLVPASRVGARVLRKAHVEVHDVVLSLNASLKRLGEPGSGIPYLSIKGPFRPRSLERAVPLKGDVASIDVENTLLPEV